MTPEEAAVATTESIGGVASCFMWDPATYATGTELGFAGMDFYVAGRGAALGDVDADVVSAAFIFVEPAAVRTAWEASALVMDRAETARRWAEASHSWGKTHIPDEVDSTRLVELAHRVVANVNPAGAPLFAGWRALPVPTDDPKATAIHHLNALRELRGGWHGAAVLCAGLEPLEAVMTKTPGMAGIFGWPEPFPDPAPARDRWDAAEAATNTLMTRALGILDPEELTEFVTLMTEVYEATKP